MAIDKAAWHHEADNFPPELDESAGATHIGFFLAWAVFNDLVSEEFLEDFEEALPLLQQRDTTPGAFIWQELEGKLAEGDLSAEGCDFAEDCYDDCILIYESKMTDGPDGAIYRVADSWENYEKAAAIFDEAYRDWKQTRG